MAEMPLHDDVRMSDELFQLFARLIYEFAGIHLNDQKKILVVSRLQKRLMLLRLKSFHDYYKLVLEDDEERIIMLNSITTNTTKFFRENHHFEFLRDTLIPELLQTRQASREIRIWSAGCSTGEEPYSIAVTVCEALRDCFHTADPAVPYCGWDIRILATDISTKVLELAQAGLYEREQIPVGIPPELLQRYFLKGHSSFAGKVKVKAFLKDPIRFRRLNFKESTYPFSKKFDLIFCRNVMIYFDDPMKNHVFHKFHQHLAHDGHLFLGHSETMTASTSMFSPVHITVYRRQ